MFQRVLNTPQLAAKKLFSLLRKTKIKTSKTLSFTSVFIGILDLQSASIARVNIKTITSLLKTGLLIQLFSIRNYPKPT